jgi:hypothetical protein
MTEIASSFGTPRFLLGSIADGVLWRRNRLASALFVVSRKEECLR